MVKMEHKGDEKTTHTQRDESYKFIKTETWRSYSCRFLYGGLEDKKKLHLVDLNSIMNPCDKWGLGISHLNNLNAILIAKWIYRLLIKRYDLRREVICTQKGPDSSKILPIVNRSSRKSALFNLIGSILDGNEQVSLFVQ